MAITLDYPVTVEGDEYSVLKMRRPKVRDMKAAEKASGSEAETETMLFANLCEVPPAVIDELDMHDYGKVQEQYRDFLSAPGKTSGEPAS